MNLPTTPYARCRLPLAVAALALCLSGAIAAGQDKAEEIDGLMTIFHDCGNFSGAVLVAEHGKVIFKKGFGPANREWKIPNTPDTKFRIGSVTKQFTAMLVMQLVAKGKIELEAPISRYLSDYRRDTGETITVHHLLTHTSGLPSYTSRPGFVKHVSRDPYEADAFIKKYCSLDLQFQPGTKHAYSNSGYFLLGAIIEKVSDRTYEDMLKANILEPLAMKNSGYDHPDAILEKRASAYHKTKTGYRNAPYLDMSVPFAAGAMYSTVEDLLRWDQALYTEKLLPEKYKALMFTPFLSNCAYGWFVREVRTKEGGPTVTVIQHGGTINGFCSMIWRIADKRRTIILLHNAGHTKLNLVAQRILEVLCADDLPPGDR